MDIKKTCLVSDYMRDTVVTVDEHATFRDALETMIQHHTNGAVVVNQQKKVKGMLSSWDLIEYLVPDYLEKDKHLAAFESADVFMKRIVEIQNDPITKFVTSHVHSIHAKASIMEAATLLSEFKIRQLPVINNEGTLIGYINRTDIKHAMGDVLGIHD
ncbi:MAG TPA: hypothetical protein DCY48_02460 [Candidatus Magasanikbacteria bacterium]|nr:hypothetical protein [Candidatus Magasanikbacteria bacterium]